MVIYNLKLKLIMLYTEFEKNYGNIEKFKEICFDMVF